MAALSSLRSSASAITARPRVAAVRAAAPRPAASQRRSAVAVRAQQDFESTSPEVDKLVKDLSDKWDKVENKTGVVLYGAGALVLVWFSSTLVSALNSIPLVPKLLELVGLGYTSWFVYRYLLFKSSREELSKDVEELKKKITGESDSAASRVSSYASSAQARVESAAASVRSSVKSTLE